jgi:HPr kinase/phosphorylase
MDEYEIAKNQQRSVKLMKIIDEAGLGIIHASSDLERRLIHSLEVNRPGLQLVGFYDYFDPKRMQIVGIVETTYLKALSPQLRYESLRGLMSRGISALVVCHGCDPLPECLRLADEMDVCVLRTELATSEAMAILIGTLSSHLAPRCTRHGVLVEVHGEGLLILGESGVGKSETALELIKRGHRLIADDAVEITRTAHNLLHGEAPDMIRYYMELRGIGVVDVRRIYGVGAVKDSVRIDMVVKLEFWDEKKYYDRLGLESETCSILDVNLPFATIPVRPGRNLAVILELAAMNNRQKRMGFNAALELAEQHDRAIDGV